MSPTKTPATKTKPETAPENITNAVKARITQVVKPEGEITRRHLRNYSIASAAIAIVLVSSFFLWFKPVFIDRAQDNAGQTLGQVALTESQLRQIISDQKIVAYWSGPQDGALYSLVVNNYHQIFIRYLPNGKGIDDNAPDYRVIATYPQSDAYAITKTAGNQANAISFINADGAQVFYSKNLSANVYVAFPDNPYEIEIFDPGNGTALSLATAPGKIVQVK